MADISTHIPSSAICAQRRRTTSDTQNGRVVHEGVAQSFLVPSAVGRAQRGSRRRP